jgi:hypothetical protein
MVDEQELRERLNNEFGDDPHIDRVVRHVMGLESAGKFRDDWGEEASVDGVIEQLKSPDGGLKRSWNWWMGMLDSFYGGYARYQL